ncbi:hypothetical protein PBI_BXZ2_52 [Mycobacterium phage Bxz2]|uniref:Uncharacterized protein n=1 Tax=Mycobacterium phage Bxz2 TaxID=205870 RepID=Q857H0_BPMB2|nr:hypothetical protein PBI_BXZ2_52 [Mycobacterium phage Bxz2]AAN01806.1 hypothetical protein PBI_BXZ2_52 [Mycobacterium phage Bxz2]
MGQRRSGPARSVPRQRGREGGLGVKRDPYIDPRTGLNNVDAILEDQRAGLLTYEEPEDER